MDISIHQVFERTDAPTHEENQLLTGLGSITRDEDPEEEKPSDGPPSSTCAKRFWWSEQCHHFSLARLPEPSQKCNVIILRSNCVRSYENSDLSR